MVQLDWKLLLKDAVFLHAPETPPVFDSRPYGLVNGAMWTLYYEFICYLLILLLGFVKILEKPRVVVLLWFVTLIAFFWGILQKGNPVPGSMWGDDAMILLGLLPMFLAGAAIYKTNVHKYRSRWLVAAAFIVLVLGLSYNVTAESAVATAGAYLLFVVGFRPVKTRIFRKCRMFHMEPTYTDGLFKSF